MVQMRGPLWVRAGKTELYGDSYGCGELKTPLFISSLVQSTLEEHWSLPASPKHSLKEEDELSSAALRLLPWLLKRLGGLWCGQQQDRWCLRWAGGVMLDRAQRPAEAGTPGPVLVPSSSFSAWRSPWAGLLNTPMPLCQWLSRWKRCREQSRLLLTTTFLSEAFHWFKWLTITE